MVKQSNIYIHLQRICIQCTLKSQCCAFSHFGGKTSYGFKYTDTFKAVNSGTKKMAGTKKAWLGRALHIHSGYQADKDKMTTHCLHL